MAKDKDVPGSAGNARDGSGPPLYNDCFCGKLTESAYCSHNRFLLKLPEKAGQLWQASSFKHHRGVIMGERNQETANPEPLDDLFEPGLGELPDDVMKDLGPVSSEKQRLVQKRRLAEQRLEEKRLRDELGDYNLEFEDL